MPVIDFVARRAVQMVLSLWAALTLVFVTITVLPGDPVRGLFPDRPPPPELYAALTAQYHLDEPLPTQYVLWLGDVLTGDLGRGFPVDARGDPGGGPLVMDLVAATLPVSAVILVGALLVQTLVGVVAGVLSVGRPRAGAGVYATALLLVGTPVIVAAAALRLVVGWQWEWLPMTGASGEPDTYVLPVLALAALSTGYVALITRAELVETLRAPYVQAARGRGLRDRRVVAVHALRPSLTSVVTFLAANVGQLVVGLTVVESIFGMPGLGGALIGAIADRDRALLLGLVAVVMAVVIVANAVADVLVAALDPRIRVSAAR